VFGFQRHTSAGEAALVSSRCRRFMELMKSPMTKGILTCTSSEGRFVVVECNAFLSHKVLPPITPLIAHEIQRGLSYSLTATKTQSNDEFQDLQLVSSKEAASYEWLREDIGHFNNASAVIPSWKRS
jgi:hypothetical protein